MEIVMEAIFEIIMGLCEEGAQNKKTPRWLRKILAAIIVVWIITVIGLFFLIGALMIKENLLGGIISFGIGIFILMASIIRFRKIRMERIQDGK